MNRNLLLGLLVILVSVDAALAGKPDFQAADVNPSKGHATVTIPAKAVEVNPNVFYLGTAVDKGMVVEGYAIVDYRVGYGKPSGCNNDGVCQGWESPSCADCSGGGSGTSSCYGFLAKGAKWKTVEPYIIDPANTRGLDESFVRANLAADIGKWEAAAGVNILGDETAGVVDGADMDSPDGRNEIYLGNISDEGAIAITIVWGVFGGPAQKRQLVEWDQVYDQVDYDWSASGEAGKMDFENIATHELGHSVGMGDLYTSECSEQTMYGYASYGETKKRTLEAGDIKGVGTLY